MIAVIFKGRESLFSRPFVSPSPLTTNCKRVIHAAGGGTPKDAHSPPPEGRRGGAQGRAQGRAQGWAQGWVVANRTTHPEGCAFCPSREGIFTGVSASMHTECF